MLGKDRWWIGLLLVLISLGVFGLFLRCLRQPAVVVVSSDPEPNLLVEHEDAVSWMGISNSFVPAGETTYWNGILLQLGDYEDSEIKFASVSLYTKDDHVTPAYTFDRDDFDWINVTSEYPGMKDPVPDPDDALALYPNGSPDETECGKLSRCAPPNYDDAAACLGCVDDCDSPIVLPPRCLRSKRIHAYQSPTAILTFWEGPGGYQMRANLDQTTTSDTPDQNSYEFVFPDEFIVSIFKERVAGDVWTMQNVHDIDEDIPAIISDVDLIRISVDSGPPEEGKHPDPPWPVCQTC